MIQRETTSEFMARQGWFMRHRGLIMLLVVGVYAIFATKSCRSKVIENNILVEAIKDKEAKIFYYKDQSGKEHARANQVTASKKQIEYLFRGKLDSISKELDIKSKQITDYIQISNSTGGNFSSKIDTFYKTSYIPVKGKDSIVKTIDYLGTKYNDTWLDFKAKIKNGTFDAEYTIKDSLDIVSYWKRTGFLGLGRKDYFIDISSKNPNTKIQNAKNFKISTQKDNKIGFGLIGGYGIDVKTFRPAPFIGVGVYYKFF